MSHRGMMVVMNDIVRDSRVLKMAAAMRKVCPNFVLAGLSHEKTLSVPFVEKYHNGVRCVFFARFEREPRRRDGEEADAFALRKHKTMIETFSQRVRGFARDFRPDILHTHDMYLFGLGDVIRADAKSEGRAVCWLHDVHEFVVGASHMPPAFQAYATEIEEENIRRPDVLLTVSEELKTELTNRYADAPPVHVIFNTPPVFPPPGASVGRIKEGLGLGDQPLIVYSGQVKERRGIEKLIPVLRAAPQFHCALLTNNNGAFVSELKASAEAAGVADRLHWLPYVPHDQVWPFLSDADVGVVPFDDYGNASVALPTKLFEYVFGRVPVVASPLRAMSTFFRDHPVGVTVDFNDPEAAAQAITRAADRAAFQGVYDDACAAAVRAYAWEAQERKLIEIYMDGLGEGGVRIVDSVVGVRDMPPAATDCLRVWHGPTASAGQPAVLARALDRLPGVCARSFHVLPSKFGYRPDFSCPVKSAADPVEMTGPLRAAAPHFDIFHFHARSFYFKAEDAAFPSGLDMLLLKAAGKKVVMHFRGSEARMSAPFRRASPFAYADVENPEATEPPRGADEAKRNHIELARAFADAVLVVDPELQTYVPEATIIERAIDLDAWREVGLSARERPLIVHAPSRRGAKGSEFVLGAVENLRARGLNFDFELVEDLSHADARKLYERADIIVDQLRIGWYGVLAVEAMALGKAVVSYIRDDLVSHFGDAPPIAIANPDTIETVLEGLIRDPDARARIAKAGRQWCETVHAAPVVAEKLRRLYEKLDAAQQPLDMDAVLTVISRQAADADDLIRINEGLTGKVIRFIMAFARRFRRLAEIRRDNGLWAVFKFLGARLKSAVGPPRP